MEEVRGKNDKKSKKKNRRTSNDWRETNRTELSTGKRLIEVLLRPLLEYGYEITLLPICQQQQIDKVMLKAGRAITGLQWNAMNVAVRGELGWSSMAERSEMAKLKFFQRLRTLPQSRLIKRIFDMRMEDALNQWNKQRIKKSWCHEMRKIMEKYGIVEEWKKRKMKETM